MIRLAAALVVVGAVLLTLGGAIGYLVPAP